VKYSKEVKVGFFAIISIAILYVGFNYLKGIEFLDPKNKYYVVYDDIAGLQVSNPVMINGFSVGRVSEINLLQELGNKVLVELEIEKDITLGDSTVAFLDIDFLGSVSIILEVDNIDIPMEIGDTLMSRLDIGLEELLKEKALPVADNLQVTIRRINTILDGLSGNTERISNTLTNIERLSANLVRVTSRENRERITESIENFKIITDELKYSITKINPMIEKYSAVADSLKTIDFKTTITKANSALDNLNSVLEKIDKSEGTLDKLIKDDSLYTNLNETLENLDKLLIHINENPKHFFGPLGKKKKKIQKDLNKQANEN